MHMHLLDIIIIPTFQKGASGNIHSGDYIHKERDFLYSLEFATDITQPFVPLCFQNHVSFRRIFGQFRNELPNVYLVMHLNLFKVNLIRP